MAMSRLGRLPTSRGNADGAAWTGRAAALGWAEAQVDVGDAHQRAGDHAAASGWYGAAAAQRHPAGLHRLGLAQLRGWGLSQDVAAARAALEASARLGWADAQFSLAQSLTPNEDEKHAWLSA